tara:strand:- start:196 stop:2064 length:1869 start_codon:yes stop_codon:yes gene_type:complete
MCGISGIINFSGKIEKKIVEDINNEILHRGPDHQSVISNSFSALGYVRLKIIDLSDSANQPFTSANKKINIFYNGEIYNSNELKETYFKNDNFQSIGDGEILLKLYEKFGINFLDKIKGMFSIVISDENMSKIYLVRDRFGIKPLYFHKNNKIKEITFCSEIHPIFKNPKVQKMQNTKEIYKNLKYGIYNSTEETWFKDVYQVKPGHFIEIKRDIFNEKKYYRLEDKIDESQDLSDNKNFYQWSNLINNKIKESFKEHSLSDVETGMHISGGADSAILGNISKFFSKPMTAFTFDFELQEYGESKQAKLIAEKFNIKHFIHEVKNSNLADKIEKVLQTEYEPFSSLRILAQHDLYEFSKSKGSKVIFDGSGGDEISAGYTYQIFPWLIDLSNNLSIKSFKRRFNKIKNNLRKNSFSVEEKILGSFLNTFAPGITTPDGSIYDKVGLINKDFLEENKSVISGIKRPFKSFLRNSQYADLYHMKLPRCLKYIDRASMKNSIEGRVPFLDHELVELNFQAPSKYKFLYDTQRILMKYGFRKSIPKKLYFKNKNTIADPQTYWLKNNLKDYFYDLVINNSKCSNIFNKKEVEYNYTKFSMEKSHINSFFILQIFLTELWFQKVLNK